MVNRKRLRWQCRRALLELDLMFSVFLDKHFDQLDEQQCETLERLLQYEDPELWSMVNGSVPCPDNALAALVVLIRQRDDNGSAA